MDAVYVLGTGSKWGDNELKYSLRSIEMFIDGIDRVFVVGRAPRWLTNAIVIPWADAHVCKERNIMEKVSIACADGDLSENFIHIHDDHFALARAYAQDVPYWRGHTLANLARAVKPSNHYHQAVLNTEDALFDNGFNTMNFDQHLPIIYNKKLFPQVMERYDWSTPRGFVVKSLYCNTLGIHGDKIQDCKIVKQLTTREIVMNIKGRPWWSIGTTALNGKMRDLLAALYPTRSKFES